MEKDPFNDLTPVMQARLEKWKKNVLPVKSADILRGKSPGNFVPRHKDHGDDFRDLEQDAQQNLHNQIFRGYR